MDKKVLGIVLILGIIAALYFFVIRKKVVVAGVVTDKSIFTDMFEQDVLKTSDIVQEPSGVVITVAKPEVLAEIPVTTQAKYMAYTANAHKALDNPDTPMGILAGAVAEALPNPDAAVIGEIIYGTQTGGVSVVSPAIADNLVKAGAEVKVFEAAGGNYANFYYQGKMIAKIQYQPYVERLKDTTLASAPASPPAEAAPAAKKEVVSLEKKWDPFWESNIFTDTVTGKQYGAGQVTMVNGKFVPKTSIEASIDKVTALTQAEGVAIYGTGYGDFSQASAGYNDPGSAWYGASM